MRKIFETTNFEYPGYPHVKEPSSCCLEVYEDHKSVLCVCTETSANQGTSVTNAAESLHKKLGEFLKEKRPKPITVVERYYYDNEGYTSHSISKVTNGVASWVHIEPEDLAAMIESGV